MVKKYPPSKKFPCGRYGVFAKVSGHPPRRESIPLPENCDRGILAEYHGRALVRELELEKEIRSGCSGSGGSLKFFKAVLEHYEPHSKHNPYVFNRLLEDIGNHEMPDIWEALEELADRLQSTATRRGASYTPASINRHISMAKAAVTHAYNTWRNRARLIPQNYISGFPLLSEHNISFRILNKNERDAYWAALPEAEKPLYYYSCRVPIRVSEAVNISKSNGNINQVAGMITLHDGSTKNGRGRMLPIPAGFEEYWQKYLKSGADYLFNRGKESGYAPLGYFDKARNRIAWGGKNAHNSACASAGVTGYNRHKTRQEAIVSLYQEGYDLKRIQYIGGWESVEAFERYYDKGLIEQIEQGQYQIDTAWHKQFSADLDQKVA